MAHKWLTHMAPLLVPKNKILRKLSLTARVCMPGPSSHVQLCDTRSVAHQAPLSMDFSRGRILESVAISSSRGSS